MTEPATPATPPPPGGWLAVDTPGRTFDNGAGPGPNTSVNYALAWIAERDFAVGTASAFHNPTDPRHLLAVLLCDQARAVLDLHAAVRRLAGALANNVALISSAAHHDVLGHAEAATARQEGRTGAVVLEGHLAAAQAAEAALGRLAAAWQFSRTARARADRCTHGADCEIHPGAARQHNYDPPWC